MKLKQLESHLGSLEQFSTPKIELEQYPTGPHIASRMLYTAENSFEDVYGKVVADFGCGCGTLGLAAALLGAENVIGLDIDADSLEIASENADELELDMDFIQCDIQNLKWRGQVVETVVMNPPFGTRRKGADMDFLSVAMKVASQAVYSLHKTTTREHVKRAALRDYNARSAEVICEIHPKRNPNGGNASDFQLHSFDMMCHSCINFTRKRRSTLLWTSGVLFLKEGKKDLCSTMIGKFPQTVHVKFRKLHF